MNCKQIVHLTKNLTSQDEHTHTYIYIYLIEDECIYLELHSFTSIILHKYL